jgi:hypothetical protein
MRFEAGIETGYLPLEIPSVFYLMEDDLPPNVLHGRYSPG